MVALPENVEFDLENNTATMPIERYKALRLAETRYNWILKEAQTNSISHLNTIYIKLGWPDHLTLNEAIDNVLRDEIYEE